MDKMMYVAMSGARQVMLKQASNSHNLANLNTNGFKADIDNFKAMPVYGPGLPGRVYGENHRSGVDHSPGQLISTGVPLDVALAGDGFSAVQDVDGGGRRLEDPEISTASLLPVRCLLEDKPAGLVSVPVVLRQALLPKLKIDGLEERTQTT